MRPERRGWRIFRFVFLTRNCKLHLLVITSDRTDYLYPYQKNAFSLLGPQEKVARFEAKLRTRNSPAIFPNHLGSALKLIWQSRQAGRCVRPFKKDPARAAAEAAASASASNSHAFGGARNGSGSVGGAGDWNIQLPPFLMNRARKNG